MSLLQDLAGIDKLRPSQRISSGEKLLMFIQVLTRSTNRVIAERWQHSSSTVSAVVTEGLCDIAALESDVIKPPTEGIPGHIRSSPKFYPYFKNCIGTHIPVVVPESTSAPFRNRKGDLAQNVLGVCDFDMIFCYALAGWEGSAHDGRVLGDAVSRKKKFPLLRSMLPYPVSKQVKLVKAITLYNYIRMMAEAFGPLDEPDPSDPSPGANAGVSASERDDDAAMSTLRDDISAKMWADYCVYIADRDQTIVV